MYNNNDFHKAKKNKIKQHFVPQFYLKNFSKVLHVFDKKTEENFTTTPKKVAFKTNFYEGTKYNLSDIENIFSKFEMKHSASIKELINNKNYYSLKHSDQLQICEFLTFQYLRTEQTQKDIHMLLDTMRNTIQKSKIPPEVILTHDNFENADIQIDMLFNNPQITTLFFKMKFVILENNTQIPFWTSDNPLAKQNEFDQTPFGTLGIVNSGIEFHLPLTNQLSLLALDPTVFNSVLEKIRCDEQRVIRENFLQFRFSSRFLYSNSKKFHRIKNMLNDCPHYKDENLMRSYTLKIKYKNGIGTIQSERNFRWPIEQNKPLLNDIKTWIPKDLLDEF